MHAIRVIAVLASIAAGCGSKTSPEGSGSGSGSGSGGVTVVGSGSNKVLQIDPAEAVRQYDAACVANNFEACRNLGLLYVQGRGVPKDEARGAALFAQACNGNNLAACNQLGVAMAQGAGVPRDGKKAAELYERACGSGFTPACGNLGLMLRDGDGVPEDHVKAASMLDRACRAGMALACNHAGDLDWRRAHKAADEAAKKQHVKDMLEHFTVGCNGRDAASCRKIGIAYVEGFGLPKAASTAVVWFERALKLAGDPIAMRYLGLMKLAGAGTAQDPKAGLALLERACAAQDEVACRAKATASGSGSGSASPPPDAGVKDAK